LRPSAGRSKSQRPLTSTQTVGARLLCRCNRNWPGPLIRGFPGPSTQPAVDDGVLYGDRSEILSWRWLSQRGIDLPDAPKPPRLAAWRRRATDLGRKALAAMTTAIGFDDIERAARDIVAGAVRGRIVPKIA
jgi:hypothetical protein